jgi:hypothetical protein
MAEDNVEPTATNIRKMNSFRTQNSLAQLLRDCSKRDGFALMCTESEIPPARRSSREHAKGAPGLAFETWDPPIRGQSSPALRACVRTPFPNSVPQGRLNFRAVQISGLVDSARLILLDKRVLRPGRAKPGWGSGAADLETCCPNVCDKTPALRPIHGLKSGG